jgi:hypothetical protein
MGPLMKTYLYEFTAALWWYAECYIFAFIVFDIYSGGGSEFENKDDEIELV